MTILVNMVTYTTGGCQDCILWGQDTGTGLYMNATSPVNMSRNQCLYCDALPGSSNTWSYITRSGCCHCYSIIDLILLIFQTAHLWANTGVVLESCPSLG